MNILIVYAFHVVFIVMSFLMMQHYYDGLQIVFWVLGSIYLIYWIISNRKTYMPWSVYVHFVVGSLVQILLNNSGIILKDSGWFSGLGQFFYIIFLNEKHRILLRCLICVRRAIFRPHPMAEERIQPSAAHRVGSHRRRHRAL